jgi:hypothetical protein
MNLGLPSNFDFKTRASGQLLLALIQKISPPIKIAITTVERVNSGHPKTEIACRIGREVEKSSQ